MEADQLHERILKMEQRLTQNGQANSGRSLWISQPEAGKRHVF